MTPIGSQTIFSAVYGGRFEKFDANLRQNWFVVPHSHLYITYDGECSQYVEKIQKILRIINILPYKENT